MLHVAGLLKDQQQLAEERKPRNMRKHRGGQPTVLTRLLSHHRHILELEQRELSKDEKCGGVSCDASCLPKEKAGAYLVGQSQWRDGGIWNESHIHSGGSIPTEFKQMQAVEAILRKFNQRLLSRE